MTKLTLLGAAAILATALATPAMAQEATQEPGMIGFNYPNSDYLRGGYGVRLPSRHDYSYYGYERPRVYYGPGPVDKGQPIVLAALGQRPEYELRQRLAVRGMGLQAAGQHLGHRRFGAPGGDLHRDEIRRQADRTGPGIVRREMLEQVRHRLTQRRHVPNRRPGESLQPFAHFGFRQVKHQIVRPQAGDVDPGVEALERIVELVGQEDRRQLTLLQDLLRPVGLRQIGFRRIVHGFPVVHGNPLAVEPEELAGDFDQPTVLGRVFDRAEVGHQPLAFFPRIQIRRFDLPFGHARGMGQFRVVMVTQNVGQRPGRGSQGVDVRVRIGQRQAVQFGKQPIAKCCGHGAESLTWVKRA